MIIIRIDIPFQSQILFTRFVISDHISIGAIKHEYPIKIEINFFFQILLTSQKSINKGPSYNYLHPWMKTGLLTSSGKYWTFQRFICLMRNITKMIELQHCVYEKNQVLLHY